MQMPSLRFLSTLLFGFVVLISTSISNTAQALTEAKKAELNTTISKFIQVTKDSQFEDIISISMSPAMLEEIAKPTGLTLDVFKPLMAKQVETVMNSVEFLTFSMDTESITYELLEDGSEFARIPTTSLMKVSGQKIRATSETLGVQDNGQWYLFRISDPKQINLFRKVYPQFSDVSIVKDKIERVD